MNDKASTPSKKKPEDKLAKALRDNLHRRKAQARARATTDKAAEIAGVTNPTMDDQDQEDITNG